jgi:hypothetical protein
MSIIEEYRKYFNNLSCEKREKEIKDLRNLVIFSYTLTASAVGPVILNILSDPKNYNGMEYVYKAFVF